MFTSLSSDPLLPVGQHERILTSDRLADLLFGVDLAGAGLGCAVDVAKKSLYRSDLRNLENESNFIRL